MPFQNYVEFLKYVGSKSSGTMNVRKLHPLSPWRRMPYSAGMRLRIDEQIPRQVAETLVSQYPKLFKIDKEEISVGEAFRDQLNLLMCNFIEDMELDNMFMSVKQSADELTSGDVPREVSFENQFNFLLGDFRDLNPDQVAKILKKCMAEFRKYMSEES